MNCNKIVQTVKIVSLVKYSNTAVMSYAVYSSEKTCTMYLISEVEDKKTALTKNCCFYILYVGDL